MSLRCFLLCSPVLVLFAGCGDKDVEESDAGLEGEDSGADSTTGDDDTDDDDDDDDDGDGGEDDEPKIAATVTGTVSVEVYETIDGVYTEVDVNERYGGVYPFGAIFVGAYDDPTNSGSERYRGIDTLSSPGFGPDPFSLDVLVHSEGPVHVYAAVDANANAVVDSTDPIGVWPVEVEIVDGGLTEDVAIRVVVNLDNYKGGGGSGCCGDGTSEGCTVTVSGEVEVDHGFSGTGLAMILGTDGSGPHYADWFEATGHGDASTGEYAISMCQNIGSVKLIGAIDENGNGLIDPADTYGAYVTAPDTDGNPIQVATTDLTEHTIQIPLYGADGQPLDNGIEVIPFVRLYGSIASALGTFDDFGAGSTLHVAALKYRPNTSFGTSVFDAGAYDYQTFAWGDLSGESAVDYQLLVPANVELYLWAYVDTDIDGTVNEVGEPVGSAPALEGALSTGSSNIAMDITVDIP